MPNKVRGKFKLTKGLSMRSIGVLFIILFLGASRSPAQNLQEAFDDHRLVLISDFDNTLTGPAWKTFWYLKKIPSLQTWFQAQLTANYGGFDYLPAEIPITEQEFTERVRDKMAVREATGDYTPRSFEPLLLPAVEGSSVRSRPITLVPGIYTVTNDSFRDFRSQQNSMLLVDNDISRQNETQKESRFGLSFPIFQKLASRQENLENIYVVTARAQGEQEFLDLFNEWVREGWLRFTQVIQRGVVRSSINVFPMGQGEGLLYGQKLSQRKVQLVRDQIINHYRLLANQRQRKYTLIIAENDPDTIKSYFQMLAEIMTVKEFKKHLDVLLVHAGSQQEVERSGLPSRYTTFKNGFPQAASSEDIRWLQKKNLAETPAPESKLKAKSPSANLKCIEVFGRLP